jgi:hypothetical protein
VDAARNLARVLTQKRLTQDFGAIVKQTPTREILGPKKYSRDVRQPLPARKTRLVKVD